MTESEWLVCEDPAAMLNYVNDWLRTPGQIDVSDCKLRSWVEACRYAAGVGPWANKLGTNGDLMVAVSEWSHTHGASWKEEVPNSTRCALLREILGLHGLPLRPMTLPPIGVECRRCRGEGRVIAGSGGQVVGMEPRRRCLNCGGRGFRSHPWLTPDVLKTAQGVYDERLADGTLDPARLAVLSDALEEAGCNSAELLSHLRGADVCPWCLSQQSGESKRLGWPSWCNRCGGTGTRRAGPHVRGCWCVDLILGKS